MLGAILSSRAPTSWFCSHSAHRRCLNQFHGFTLLLAWSSPACSHQRETPSRQAEPHQTPLRPCKSKSQVRLPLPFTAHKSPATRFPGEQRGGGGKGESRNVGHELLSSREWCHSGLILQFQEVWAAGTGSQMSESRDKGTPWGLGTKGIRAAAKGQESSTELLTHRERSWPTRLGRWAGSTSRAAPQSSPSAPGCSSRAVPPWPGQLVAPSSSQ